MINLSMAKENDAFEVVSMKFKGDLSLDDQKAMMLKLNDIVKQFQGFKSRDYFFSHESKRWIDFVIWTDIESAKKASELVMGMPEAGAVFSQIEEETMIFSHYDYIGGHRN